jgi:hypothetical protein
MADQVRILLKWTAEHGVHHHKLCSLTRVPSCGEYIILDEDIRHEYKVMMVAHIAQPADYAAELFVQRSLYDLEEEL